MKASLKSMSRGQMNPVSAPGLVADDSWQALITLHLPPQVLVGSPGVHPST